MTKKFISVPTKLLLLIVSTLLFLAIGFSSLSLSRLQEDYKQFQRHTLDQGQAQFALHSDILRSKLNVWLESFAEITQFTQQNDFTVFSQQFANQFDGLQLNLNVENVWLVGEQKNILFETSIMPAVVQENVEQVLKLQQPHHQIFCQQQCKLLLSVPLLNNQGKVVVVTMSASLVDMLYAINTSLNSDVAVISLPLNSADNTVDIISASNMELAQLLLDANKEVDLDLILKQGVQIDLADNSYLVNLLPLAQRNQQGFYLSLIDNVTPFKDKNAHYRQQFLISLSALFFILGFFVYFVARPFTKRLLRLSGALPLLANKKNYKQLNPSISTPFYLFVDHLGQLTAGGTIGDDDWLSFMSQMEEINTSSGEAA